MLYHSMSKGKNDKTTRKPCKQGWIYLIPPGADELIPANHLVVRLVQSDRGDGDRTTVTEVPCRERLISSAVVAISIVPQS